MQSGDRRKGLEGWLWANLLVFSVTPTLGSPVWGSRPLGAPAHVLLYFLDSRKAPGEAVDSPQRPILKPPTPTCQPSGAGQAPRTAGQLWSLWECLAIGSWGGQAGRPRSLAGQCGDEARGQGRGAEPHRVAGLFGGKTDSGYGQTQALALTLGAPIPTALPSLGAFD